MKYTKEQLQAMSDFEVNKALAELVYKDVYFFDRQSDTQKALMLAPYCACEPIDILTVDYCNTPNDIMPLAFEHRISLIENDDGYTAYHKFSIYEDINYRIEHGAYFGDANPLRAIACCLILVLQGA